MYMYKLLIRHMCTCTCSLIYMYNYVGTYVHNVTGDVERKKERKTPEAMEQVYIEKKTSLYLLCDVYVLSIADGTSVSTFLCTQKLGPEEV